MQEGSNNQQFLMSPLDGLRGIAALIVVLSHTSNVGYYFIPGINMSGTGKSGVYLFFILSSFLLTLPLLYMGKDIFTKKTMIYYWSRRTLRIYPLYLLYLTAGLLSSLALNTLFGPKEWAIPFQLDLYSYLEHLILQEGYSVTWSIAVEFKYYFLLPIYAFILSCIFKCRLLPSIAFLLLNIIVFLILFPANSFKGQTVEIGPYMPTFLTGTILAIIQFNIREGHLDLVPFKKIINHSAYIGLCVFILIIPSVYSVVFEPVASDYFSKDRILYSLLWAIILFSAINGSTYFSQFLSTPYLRYIGTISFSAYLFHPVYIDLMRHFKFETPVNAWIVLLLTLFFSHISYIVIERPCMKLKVFST